jgi:hypothetical protein
MLPEILKVPSNTNRLKWDSDEQGLCPSSLRLVWVRWYSGSGVSLPA